MRALYRNIPQVLQHNLGVILPPICYGKISFIVFVPGRGFRHRFDTFEAKFSGLGVEIGGGDLIVVRGDRVGQNVHGLKPGKARQVIVTGL